MIKQKTVSNTKILLVDDDRLVLSTLSSSLQSAGYQVETASSGETAIRLCEHKTPDLAVLDMRMPGMDGIEVACWMSDRTEIPFIFLSAHGEDDVVEKAVASGAMGYLLKPVDSPQLIAMVSAVLERSAEQQMLRNKERQLTQALSGDRAISTAVGILIGRERLNEKQAFELLRKYARSNHRKLADVAHELVETAEKLNLFASSCTSAADNSR
ncbi:MAG: response regulator [Candidatus Thiodiazotropha sp. (ex Codakia rugifera)]|nr:response regulator [Candidatus Thiodiazotropha sp. (ex Codakia rugifera)]